MAIQASGAITFSDIQTELGGSHPISMSEYYSTAVGLPSAGQFSMNTFHGVSFAPPEVAFSSGNLAGGDLTRSWKYLTYNIPDAASTVEVTVVGTFYREWGPTVSTWYQVTPQFRGQYYSNGVWTQFYTNGVNASSLGLVAGSTTKVYNSGVKTINSANPITHLRVAYVHRNTAITTQDECVGSTNFTFTGNSS